MASPDLSKFADAIMAERKKKPDVEVSAVEIKAPELADVLREFKQALDKDDFGAAARSFKAAHALCADEGYEDAEPEGGETEEV
jgi:hypothetical protein